MGAGTSILRLHVQQVEAAKTAKSWKQRRRAVRAAAQDAVAEMFGGKKPAPAPAPAKKSGRAANPIPTEHEEQVNFVKWFRLQFPRVMIFAIPNGGDRHAAVAAKMRAEGVTPGIPDLFIPDWRLFLEMKRRKGGRVSPEQKRVMEHLEMAGYTCAVARGFDEAMDIAMEQYERHQNEQ